jgi:hypothetical protein
MLRAGTNVVTLARLMGHSDLSILNRYAKETDEDLRMAHEKDRRWIICENDYFLPIQESNHHND